MWALPQWPGDKIQVRTRVSPEKENVGSGDSYRAIVALCFKNPDFQLVPNVACAC